jgi:hypothetical protein
MDGESMSDIVEYLTNPEVPVTYEGEIEWDEERGSWKLVGDPTILLNSEVQKFEGMSVVMTVVRVKQ